MGDEVDGYLAYASRMKGRESKTKKPRPSKYNKKPEESVVKEIVDCARAEGFFIKRYESKAKNVGGRWINSGMAFGTPDLMACSPDGYFCAIEVKAPGKRVASCLRDNQRKFLIDIIKHNGFGIVTDSKNHFLAMYYKWLKLEGDEAINFLLNDLP